MVLLMFARRRIICMESTRISSSLWKKSERLQQKRYGTKCRDGSRTAATSKMERFVIIVNGWKSLTIITKRSILDVAAVLDLPLKCLGENVLGD